MFVASDAEVVDQILCSGALLQCEHTAQHRLLTYIDVLSLGMRSFASLLQRNTMLRMKTKVSAQRITATPSVARMKLCTGRQPCT